MVSKLVVKNSYKFAKNVKITLEVVSGQGELLFDNLIIIRELTRFPRDFMLKRRKCKTIFVGKRIGNFL